MATRAARAARSAADDTSSSGNDLFGGANPTGDGDAAALALQHMANGSGNLSPQGIAVGAEDSGEDEFGTATKTGAVPARPRPICDHDERPSPAAA